ncbi:Multidrug resistance protein MdtL [Talaromyces islandicus]|uniref:Multidrug resistance protein MdtL n=1 Tax=Talaromyces islandicus TaxID=28573 RepID=A0A0U1LLN2_TALIS|nr:Multidrug resistance protein MdtL [Talaromyces islandicus]
MGETKSSQPSVLDVSASPPPLTGKQWIQVLSAFVVFLNTWGLLLAFGSFQTYYEQVLLPEKSSSEIAWISTICAFILLVSGLITGPLFDYGYLRPLLLVGSLLEVFGLMMVSLSTEYYQLFLSQGICVGIGGGMLYIPSIAAAAASLQEFRRAKFIGLIASATGIGGVIYPIMFRRLVSSVGFPWTARIIAFVMFGAYIFSYPILLYKPAPSPSVRRWVDVTAFTDLSFILANVGAMLSAIAYYLPMIYLPLFAETGIRNFGNGNGDLAFYLISIVNGASVVGRLAAGLVATKIGPIETFNSTAGAIAWSIIWGLVSSVIVALPGAIIPLLSPSLKVIGTRSGMYWASVGLGVLIGGPVAGALIDINAAQVHWWKLQIFAGTFMAVATICYIYPISHSIGFSYIVVDGRLDDMYVQPLMLISPVKKAELATPKDPHIVIEALKLAKKRHLDIYYRPEPRAESICRRNTGAERYMGMIFRKYLEKILLSSPDAFHLRLIDPTTTSNSDNTVSFSTPAADQSSPILPMRILTPKFYYFALNNHGLNSLLMAAFLDPAVENRTAHVDDNTTKVIELLTRAAAAMAKQEQVKKPTSRIYLSLLWMFWMTARVKLPFTGVAYPDIGTPAARARANENHKSEGVSFDETQNGSYFLDDFVRYSHSPLDQTKYVVWGVGLLARELILSIVGGA